MSEETVTVPRDLLRRLMTTAKAHRRLLQHDMAKFEGLTAFYTAESRFARANKYRDFAVQGRIKAVEIQQMLEEAHALLFPPPPPPPTCFGCGRVF